MSWQKLMDDDRELAEIGRQRLHGRVSYLATARKNGAPRVHPVTPFTGAGRLFLFMEPASPKGLDIQRGSHYALHCGVEDNEGGGGEFYVWGEGQLISDSETRDLATQYCPYKPAERYVLYELQVERAMATTYGDTGPIRHRWQRS
jgi:hypothetical protein